MDPLPLHHSVEVPVGIGVVLHLLLKVTPSVLLAISGKCLRESAPEAIAITSIFSAFSVLLPCKGKLVLVSVICSNMESVLQLGAGITSP